jgi:hypothetical protein
MNEEHAQISKKNECISKKESSSLKPEPFLRWKYTLNEETSKYQINSIQLSDESELNVENLKDAVKRATGASDPEIGEYILKKVARGLSGEENEARLNQASALLPALCPRDETEAMLLGQFLTLNDSGIKCLREANQSGQGFYNTERLLILAQKLFNTANQTILTVLKYRSGGQQTMQIIHVHNEGQAIVAQNLSSSKHMKDGV